MSSAPSPLRATVAVTPKGRDAFHREVTALRALLAAVDEPRPLQQGIAVIDTAS